MLERSGLDPYTHHPFTKLQVSSYFILLCILSYQLPPWHLQETPLVGQNRVAQRRQEEIEANPMIGIAHHCTPTKYLPYQALANSVASTLLQYFTKLQQNDCPARVENRSSVLNQLDYKRDHSLVKFSDHLWNNMDCTHYVLIASLLGLHNQLSTGLPLPVLISPLSRLGKDISAQTHWSQSSLRTVLDRILVPDSTEIAVQDHSKPKLDTFTISKSCKVVRNRFNLPFQNRGPAWNCLEAGLATVYVPTTKLTVS